MKSFSRYIKWVVSIAFFAVLFAAVGKADLLDKIKQVNLQWMTFSFLLIPVLIGMSCLKWRVVLGHLGHPLKFARLLRIYMIGYFFTNLLPSAVGGDVIRSYYAGKDINDQTHSAVSVFIERFTGLLLLLVLGIVAPMIKPSLYGHIGIVIPAVLAGVLLVVIAWLCIIPNPLRFPDSVARWNFGLWRKVNKTIGLGSLNRLVDKLEGVYGKIHAILENFHKRLMLALKSIGKSPRTFFAITALTLLFYFMTWVNVYFAFRTFNIEPEFWVMSAVIPTIMLTFLLPVSQGNLGLAEGAYVFYFGLIGVDMESSFAMALFMRFKLIFVGLIGYFFYLAQGGEKPNLKEIPSDV